MKFTVLTLFPDLIRSITETSITGRAIKSGVLSVDTVNIRDFSTHGTMRVDDYPYGGGAGMVMEAEPVFRAVSSVIEGREKKPRVIYFTPQAEVITQSAIEEFAREDELILLCGHYEGIDERVLEEVVTDNVSIGDYVLTGGELAAAVFIDAVSRFVPGVLHNDESARFESLQDDLLEYPHYTRPEIWHDKAVPGVLLSGDHAAVEAWRYEQSLERTAQRRPDLLSARYRVTAAWCGGDGDGDLAARAAASISSYASLLDYGRKKIQKRTAHMDGRDLLIVIAGGSDDDTPLSEIYRNVYGSDSKAVLIETERGRFTSEDEQHFSGRGFDILEKISLPFDAGEDELRDFAVSVRRMLKSPRAGRK